eukprot:symbB.v1.2.033643.t1/scaffold4209.1/size43054/4
MWSQMSLQLQLHMGPLSNYPAIAMEKFVAETSQACMLTGDKGFWSPCMRETWMPAVNICGNMENDTCDVHSKGSGVCSVRIDGAAYSLTHCGVYPAPVVNQAQGREVQLFCPSAVPIAVFPILKCAHTALSHWLAKLESLDSQEAVSKLLREFHNGGATSYVKAAKEKQFYDEITTLWLQEQVNFGGPDSFFNTLLQDVSLLGHNASLPSKVGWAMKLVSRLLFATGGHILPDSHLYLPPHLCCSCCTNAKGRLPVVVVRNPFSRLASNWRLTVIFPLQWALQQNTTDPAAKALRSLSSFPKFVSFVQGLLTGTTLDTVGQVAKAENLQGDRVPPWPPSHPLSLGDLLHLIPVADLLKSVPSEWKDRRKMFLHMEHLEDDLRTLASVLCSNWGFCSQLPNFPHIKPTDEHPRENWGDAEKLSWAFFHRHSQSHWTQDLAKQVASIYSEDFHLLGYDPTRPDKLEPLHPLGDLPGMQVASPLEARNIVPLVYVWLIALCVMLSRSRFGGLLAVNIGGRSVVQHSCLQIFIGAAIGTCLGIAAFWLESPATSTTSWPTPNLLGDQVAPWPKGLVARSGVGISGDAVGHSFGLHCRTDRSTKGGAEGQCRICRLRRHHGQRNTRGHLLWNQ